MKKKQFSYVQYTVVGLGTRPNPLIISKYLQFRTFWSQSKALFVIRCMSNVGSGSKMIGALKVTIVCQIFELSVHKMSNFLRISACEWTMPNDFLLKKSPKNFLLLLAVVSKFKNAVLTSPSGKKKS